MANPKSTAQIAGHPFHPMLVPFPIAFLVGTFVADIVYSSTKNPFWAQMAYWLLIAALVMAGLAAIAGFADFLGDRLIRAKNQAWYHMIGNLTAVVLSLINFWFRYHDGLTADYPKVLIISLVVVLLLLFTGWMGGELVYRGRVGVSEETPGPR